MKDKICFGLDAFGKGKILTDFPRSLESEIVVQPEHEGLPVTGIGAQVFFGRLELEKVVLPDSVSEVGEGAFSMCTELKEITFSSVKRVLDNGFAGCGRLELGGLEGLLYAGRSAFAGCDAICRADLASLEELEEGAFRGCEGLKELRVAGSARIISKDAFRGCKSLVKVTLEPGLKEIGPRAFSRCESLTEIVIPDGVKRIASQAFAGCRSLASVSLPDSVCELAADAFEGCDSLEYDLFGGAYYLGNDSNPFAALVEAEDDETESCVLHPDTRMIVGSAFEKCSALKSVTLSGGLIASGRDAFGGCEELLANRCGDAMYLASSENPLYALAAAIPDTEVCEIAGGAKIVAGGAFADMRELKSVSFPPGLLHIGEQAFSGDSGLKSAVFPDGLLSIGSEAFENCFKLTEVVLPSSLTYVGKNAFYGCKRLGCVFFKGSSEQWSAACFDGFDAAARVLFYSEAEPDEKEGFWHYSDGRAVPWIDKRRRGIFSRLFKKA